MRHLFELLEDLDANTWVVHPESPKQTDWQRRIALGGLMSLSIRVTQEYPNEPPQLTPHGPPASVAPLLARIDKHGADWQVLQLVATPLHHAI